LHLVGTANNLTAWKDTQIW